MYIEELKPEHVGKRISCYIEDNIIIDAKIQLESGKYYICQNVIKGSECHYLLGYKYSWTVARGSYANMLENGVSRIILLDDELKPIPPITESKPTISTTHLIKSTNKYLTINQNE